MTTPAPPAPTASADGRVARGERTRRVIAEALIALLQEGDPQPTARRVAERAGVSLRLVFHHFDDMEQVLQAAVDVQLQRHWNQLHPVDKALPLGERVARLVHQRSSVYQAIAPVRRAAMVNEATSSVLREQLQTGRQQLRTQLDFLLDAEAHRAGPAAADLLDSIEALTSFEVWDQLRRRQGKSQDAAETLMTAMVGAVLADHGIESSTGRET